jgi:hypothetical protein
LLDVINGQCFVSQAALLARAETAQGQAAMTIDEIHVGSVISGPLLPEPVEVLAVITLGDSIKLIGKGCKTGLVRDPVLTPAQLSQLRCSPVHESFDGDPALFRLGIEAHRLGLAYEYDPFFSLSIARVDPLPHQLESDYHSSLVTWMSQPSKETVGHTFARPALSMVWGFAEANPLAGSSGGWQHSLDFVVKLVDTESGAQCQPGRTAASDATKHPLPDDSVDAFITDPPYYDAVPYADLSEFFIVWLKKSLHKTSVHDTFLSKDISKLECVLDEVKGHDPDFFHRTMHSALSEGRRICKPSGIAIIVFAHKATAAWELLLQSIIDAGWVMTGSWPIDTERGSRLRAMDSAALASSVHLVCRPRAYPDGSLRDNDTGEWPGLTHHFSLGFLGFS